MSDSDSQQYCGPDRERQLASAYFFSRPTELGPAQGASRHFGTVVSVVGSTAVIRAEPAFDLIAEAVVRAGASAGQVFDLMGDQFNPLYVARFDGPVAEGAEVLIDMGTVVRAALE